MVTLLQHALLTEACYDNSIHIETFGLAPSLHMFPFPFTVLGLDFQSTFTMLSA